MTSVFFCSSIKDVWAFYNGHTGCKTSTLQLQAAVAVFNWQHVSSILQLAAQALHSRDAGDSQANYNIPGTIYICPLKHMVGGENWSVQAVEPAERAH